MSRYSVPNLSYLLHSLSLLLFTFLSCSNHPHCPSLSLSLSFFCTHTLTFSANFYLPSYSHFSPMVFLALVRSIDGSHSDGIEWERCRCPKITALKGTLGKHFSFTLWRPSLTFNQTRSFFYRNDIRLTDTRYA